MFDTPTNAEISLTNASLVLPDAVHRGAVRVVDGRIAEIADHIEGGTDCGGDYLIPGLVDVHTDHVEKHLIPRMGVIYDYLGALLAQDAQVTGAGVTTVFDSISVGAFMKNPERREILDPLLDALEEGRGAGLFRADHLIHLRCEVVDIATIKLIDANIGRAPVRLVSVMDHTPGDRQIPSVEQWISRSRDLGTPEELAAEFVHMKKRSETIGPKVRDHVVQVARAAGKPLMSHDDRSVEHIRQAVDEGVAISEFPTTLESAHAARAAGMAIVAGAPNYLRGGSQSGNVNVADLLQEGLVDILASDYVPRSMIDAAFRIAEDPDLPQTLPEAIAMVTSAPAKSAGLQDRGAIEVGLSADLARVKRHDRVAHVTALWRGGRRIA